MSSSANTVAICSNVSRRKSSRFWRVLSIRSISRFIRCRSRFFVFSIVTRMSSLFCRRLRFSSAFRCRRRTFCSSVSFWRLMRCCSVCFARTSCFTEMFFIDSSGTVGDLDEDSALLLDEPDADAAAFLLNFSTPSFNQPSSWLFCHSTYITL
uniref:Uncharacterized protein n=1 Tax=Anopheles coluzzii TaxID=1518534 RepID=A0A8W7PCF1_ANOCL